MQIATISTRKYKTREAPEPYLNEANTMAAMFVTSLQFVDVTKDHTYGKAATVPSATRKINVFLLELSC